MQNNEQKFLNSVVLGDSTTMVKPVMPDCRGVGKSLIYSKHAKKSPSAGFVPQSGITGSSSENKINYMENKCNHRTSIKAIEFVNKNKKTQIVNKNKF